MLMTRLQPRMQPHARAAHRQPQAQSRTHPHIGSHACHRTHAAARNQPRMQPCTHLRMYNRTLTSSCTPCYIRTHSRSHTHNTIRTRNCSCTRLCPPPRTLLPYRARTADTAAPAPTIPPVPAAYHTYTLIGIPSSGWQS
ncbi:unnamed protein product [Closterium sp. NIES-54]